MLSAAAFFLCCLVLTAACFPAAPILGLSAGALFGLWPGLAIMLGAWVLGSTIAFFGARFFLRDWVKRTFGKRIDSHRPRLRSPWRAVFADPAPQPGRALLAGQPRHGADDHADRGNMSR